MARTVRNAQAIVNTYCTAILAMRWGMQDAHERLQSARRAAGYADATAAARAFGWNENSYRSHENGQRGLRRDSAEKYARAFRVSPAWLLTGEGIMLRKNVMPVWGHVGLGEEVTLVDGQDDAPLEQIELPFGFALENCGALIAKGDSQYPRVKNGEVVIYQRTDRPPADLVGRECVVKLIDGRVLLKTIRRGVSNGLFDLESHSRPLQESVKLDWVAELIAIIPHGKWKFLA